MQSQPAVASKPCGCGAARAAAARAAQTRASLRAAPARPTPATSAGHPFRPAGVWWPAGTARRPAPPTR